MRYIGLSETFDESQMPHRPRAERDLRRCRAAGSAMDATLVQIATTFDEAAAINDFKMRIERWLRFGPQHTAVRARFRARVVALQDCTLDAALATIECW